MIAAVLADTAGATAFDRGGQPAHVDESKCRSPYGENAD